MILESCINLCEEFRLFLGLTYLFVNTPCCLPFITSVLLAHSILIVARLGIPFYYFWIYICVLITQRIPILFYPEIFDKLILIRFRDSASENVFTLPCRGKSGLASLLSHPPASLAPVCRLS